MAYTNKKRFSPPPYLRAVALSAQSAGYLHDWGKSGYEFQKMLDDAMNGKPIEYESVRHEIVSYRLIKGAEEFGFECAWSGLSTPNKAVDINSLKKGVYDPKSALDYLVISHHKLIGSELKMEISVDSARRKSIGADGLKGKAVIKEELYDKAMALSSRCGEALDPQAWHPISTISRAALILADHYISSVNYQEKYGKPKTDLFANIKGGRYDDNGPSRFDQPLDWHLESVGDKAADIARDMLLQRYESLSDDTIEKILETSSHPSFLWQDASVNFINSLKIDGKSPQTLIINTAGTGAGKTRANAKFACSLNPSGRFCIGLNLRSLTLQTGDSMRDDLGLLRSEMSVVIGDRVSEKLHKSSTDAFSIHESGDMDIDVQGQVQVLPDWLKPLANKGRSAELIMPPVLVSTIDFLINASEPGKQGHHALALIRAINSDLILDELDSYDPEAMIAVLRLIQMYAMMGRHVICSSATISEPVANAVYKAFTSGADMFNAMNGSTVETSIIMIDDLQPASKYSKEKDFCEWVKHRHSNLFVELEKKPPYRMMEFLKPDDLSSESILKSITGAINQLNENTKWSTSEGRHISFGLVRVANIKSAIYLSREISDYFKEAQVPVRVCAYHSNEWRIQRFLKEKALDSILKRKGNWKERTERHPEVKSALQAEKGDLIFIVIATPVEEVGRDHDFDWAIVEPSSAQSIVQTCGRVNRHRLEPMDKPNVMVLDVNFNAQYAGDSDKKGRRPVFTRPGLEPTNPSKAMARKLYSSIRVSEMCPANIDRIDARFRLGATQMGKDEDRIIEGRISEGLDVLLKNKGSEALWMTRGFYFKYPLRAKGSKHLFRYAMDDGAYKIQTLQNPRNYKSWVNAFQYPSVQPHSNQWLSWTEEELIAACDEHGIKIEDGMALEVIKYGDIDDRKLIQDESYGFMMLKNQ